MSIKKDANAIRKTINEAITYLLKYDIGVTVDSIREYLQINDVETSDSVIKEEMKNRGLLAVHKWMLK